MDIRDAINNPVGRDVYPKLSNVELKNGSSATPVTKNLVVEVKTVEPQWAIVNGGGGNNVPNDTPRSSEDSPCINLASYLVSDKDGTYDNAILRLSYITRPIKFHFVPDGASTAEEVQCPSFEFELDPSKLLGVVTAYSEDGLFRANLEYMLDDSDIVMGDYMTPVEPLIGRVLHVVGLSINYEAKVLDSALKVTNTFGFQAGVTYMPPQMGANHTDFSYKLRYANFTNCSRDSANRIPVVVSAPPVGDGHPRTWDKFYITTLKLESEN